MDRGRNSRPKRLLLLYGYYEEETIICGFRNHVRLVPSFYTLGRDRKFDVKILNLPPLFLDLGGYRSYNFLDESLRDQMEDFEISLNKANAAVVDIPEHMIQSRELPEALAASFCHVPYNEMLWKKEWSVLGARDRIRQGEISE